MGVGTDPAYLRVLNDLRGQIRDGTLLPGARIPSRNGIIARYGVGETAAKHALAVLAAEGLIEARAGSGSYVRRTPAAGRLDHDRPHFPGSPFGLAGPAAPLTRQTTAAPVPGAGHPVRAAVPAAATSASATGPMAAIRVATAGPLAGQTHGPTPGHAPGPAPGTALTSPATHGQRPADAVPAHAHPVRVCWEHQSERVPAGRPIARRLGLAEHDPVTRTRYLLTADGHPVQLATSHEPAALTEGTPVALPEEGPYAGRGVVERMKAAGITVDDIVEEISVRPALTQEAAALSLPPGASVLVVERAHRAGGCPVEVSEIVIPADRYRLCYRLPATAPAPGPMPGLTATPPAGPKSRPVSPSAAGAGVLDGGTA
jgi:DNA-binding GntR family transcriptional regulator